MAAATLPYLLQARPKDVAEAGSRNEYLQSIEILFNTLVRETQTTRQYRESQRTCSRPRSCIVSRVSLKFRV